MIIKGISWGQNLRVSDHALTVLEEEGGIVEEPVEPSSPGEGASSASAGGEPSSFAENEKIFIPGPDPVVGSVTTVDLARKEGFDEAIPRTPDSEESLV